MLDIYLQLRAEKFVFFKDAKDLHSYRTAIYLPDKHQGLAPEKNLKNKPLITSIKSNGWFVHLFAIKVGARGYCSTTLNFVYLV